MNNLKKIAIFLLMCIATVLAQQTVGTTTTTSIAQSHPPSAPVQPPSYSNPNPGNSPTVQVKPHSSTFIPSSPLPITTMSAKETQPTLAFTPPPPALPPYSNSNPGNSPTVPIKPYSSPSTVNGAAKSAINTGVLPALPTSNKNSGNSVNNSNQSNSPQANQPTSANNNNQQNSPQTN
ncbi:13949_t:CDS:2, partial [Ambispora leptoticha]